MLISSRRVLVAALMFGVAAGGLAVPAVAKKKEAPVAAGPQLNISEAVRKGQDTAVTAFQAVRTALGPAGAVTAANRQAVLDAINAAEPGIAAAEAAAQTNEELYVAQELRYRKQSLLAAVPNGSADATRAAEFALAPYLDKLLTNPVTPKESIANYALERARIAFGKNDFPTALVQFQRARAAGSTDPLLDAFIVDTRVKLGDYAGAAADADQLITRMKTAGQQVPESYYAIGIENAYRSKNFKTAADYEIRHYADYPDPKNLHDAIARTISRANPPLDLRQRMDMWRLLRASGAIADQKERILYAQDALEVGASREAKAVLDEYKAGKTPAQLDAAFNSVSADANKRVLAAPSLAKAETDAKSGDAQAAMTAGNFYYSAGEYGKAVTMYQLAQQRGAPDPDALKISLGAALAQSGDNAGATAAFQSVAASPRKEVAAFWLAWLNSRP